VKLLNDASPLNNRVKTHTKEAEEVKMGAVSGSEKGGGFQSRVGCSL
jgi:hypothetical protein